MGANRSVKKASTPRKVTSLAVRLSQHNKSCLKKAAKLRHMSVSDYIRTVTMPQAKREIQAAREQVVALTRDEQRAFWKALNQTPVLTTAQRRLGAIMRGRVGEPVD